MRGSHEAVQRVGIDAAALKPSECDVAAALDLPFGAATIDYEGREHVPDPGTLRRIADAVDVRVTAPVRADGFDPLGDSRLLDGLPDAVDLAFVAGHPAYLSAEERGRDVAPRLGAAVERHPDAWVGTEGIERLALATGATQYVLLSPTTERDLRAIRAAGFDGDVSVYAPTVLADDEDAVLDAVGEYAARRGRVRRRLPDGAPTDASARGRAREVLLGGCREYALVGGVGAVRDRVAGLKEAGADHVVGYPADGVGSFLPE